QQVIPEKVPHSNTSSDTEGVQSQAEDKKSKIARKKRVCPKSLSMSICVVAACPQGYENISALDKCKEGHEQLVAFVGPRLPLEMQRNGAERSATPSKNKCLPSRIVSYRLWIGVFNLHKVVGCIDSDFSKLLPQRSTAALHAPSRVAAALLELEGGQSPTGLSQHSSRLEPLLQSLSQCLSAAVAVAASVAVSEQNKSSDDRMK
ncbi:Hypothetical predicted protein, partial [Drosophila guanche]